MIRLFLNDGVGVTNYLFAEVPVPPKTTNSNVLPTVFANLRMNLILATGFILLASTENGESFNVFANGYRFSGCAC